MFGVEGLEVAVAVTSFQAECSVVGLGCILIPGPFAKSWFGTRKRDNASGAGWLPEGSWTR